MWGLSWPPLLWFWSVLDPFLSCLCEPPALVNHSPTQLARRVLWVKASHQEVNHWENEWEVKRHTRWGNAAYERHEQRQRTREKGTLSFCQVFIVPHLIVRSSRPEPCLIHLFSLCPPLFRNRFKQRGLGDAFWGKKWKVSTSKLLTMLWKWK